MSERIRASARSSAVVAVALVVSVVLGGCAAYQAKERGDEAFDNGRPAAAFPHYRRAINYDPKLARNEAFMARYQVAESRAAFAEGERYARQNNWAMALERFDRAADADPDFTAAVVARTQAAQRYAVVLHSEALAAADLGDEAEAVRKLNEARALDTDNRAVMAALGSLREALPGELMAMRDQRDWAALQRALNERIATHSNDLPARLLRAMAVERQAAADKAHARSRVAFDARRLGDADAAVNEALAIEPGHGEARAMRERVDAAFARIEQLHRDADGHVAAGRWDSALNALDQAIAIYPGDPRTQGRIGTVRRQAGEAFAADGAVQLERGELNAADAAFARALAYDSSNDQAKRGRAKVSLRRGRVLERRGLAGLALLWYRDAAAQVASDEHTGAVRRVEAAMREQIRFTVSLQTDAGVNAAAGHASEFDRLLNAEMPAKGPAFMVLTPDTTKADYVSEVTLLAADVNTHQKLSQPRQHVFTEVVRVPNPHLPNLRYRYDHACRELENLERRVHYLQRELSRVPPEDEHRRNRLRDEVQRARRQVDRQQHHVRELEWELRRAPREIDEQRQSVWPYRELTFEKHGEVVARVVLTQRSDEKVVQRFEVNRSATDRDTTIENANPGLGLPEKPLELVSDERMRSDLLRSASEAAGVRMVEELVRARANAFIESANAHAAADRALPAADARVYAALTIEAVDAERAGKDFASLLAEQRKLAASTVKDRI